MSLPVSVAIFAKAPVARFAKTRLIPKLGAEGAAALQRRLTEHAVRVAVEADVGPVTLWCMPDCAHPFFAGLQQRYGIALRAQAGAELGTRMAHAAEAAGGPVLLMGTDCAVITPAHLKDCAEALAGADGAAVPVEDGGYYVLALRRPQPALFEGIAWSTPTVFAETQAKARAAGLTLKAFAPLWDIDRPEDYERAVTEGVLPAPMPEVVDLSIVIPALNAGASAAKTITSICQSTSAMRIEIIVADGGSDDDTRARAASAGAMVVTAPRGRGVQLAAGAARASGRWLLFLHADTTLPQSWGATVEEFMRRESQAQKAAYFRLAFDDTSRGARRVAALANWRARTLGLPYGDQGLLLSRALYDALGGYRDMPIMEDVDIVRRIGKARLLELPAAVTTSAERYRRDGYVLRPLRNLGLLALYFLRVPPHRIARLYD